MRRSATIGAAWRVRAQACVGELVWLVDLLDPPLGLLYCHLLPVEGILPLDNLVHLLLDLPQVLVLKWRLTVKVVVEALFDPWPDRHPCVFEEFLHGHRHHMRTGVPDPQQRIAIIVAGQPQRFLIDNLNLHRCLWWWLNRHAYARGSKTATEEVGRACRCP